MSMSLKNPEEREEGTLSDQPQLTRTTPTVPLGSWVRQPIKDMTSLGTDFEMHAMWQGYVKEPAAKDFMARSAHTITLSKAGGAHWRVIKCKSHLGIVHKLS
jgi:hypothetical protein